MKLIDLIPVIKGKKISRLVILLTFSAGSVFTYGQHQQVRLSGNNLTLKAAFKQIEQQTKLFVDYNVSDIDDSRKLATLPQGENVKDVLEELLKDTKCEIVFQDGHIIIKKQVVRSISSKVKKITGVVKDHLGEPIIGANVVEKGTTNGTVTDIDGKFSLEVPDNATLQLSYIGYNPMDVKVGKEQNLQIAMKEDTQALDEVVVIGYGIQKKVNLTGSVSTVASEKIENRPLGTVTEGLQGTMAGVTVSRQSGELGSNPTISIRGFSSLNSGGALVIVDGVPGNMNNVSPNDIESISILKDAASSSIYGARAAEGVILITTKQGKSSEKVKIQYSNNFSFQTPTILPEPNSSYDGALYANLAFTNAGGNPLYQDWMLEKFKDPSVIAVPYENNSDYYYVADFNWRDYFLKNSFQHTQNLSISGGSTLHKFMLSGSWLDQNGYFSKWGPDNYDRITVRVNLNNQLVPKKLILDTNLSLVNSDKDQTSSGTDYIMGTIMQAGNSLPLYNPDGTYARYRMQQNTMQHLKEAGFDNNKVNRFEGRMALTWNVLDGLSLKALGGYNVQWEKGKLWQRAYYKYRPTDPSNLGYINQPNKLTESSSFYNYYIGQFQANYNKTFGKHSLGILAGTSVEESSQSITKTLRSNIIGNELPSLNLGQASTAQNSYEVKDDWGLVSAFARVNYSYDDRYLLEANLRADGSSRFSDKHKWGVFPSVSLGWRVTQEAFMQNQSIFSNLKLRASYGELGNQNGLGLYDHIPVYKIDDKLIPFPGGDLQQIYAPSLPSKERTWETLTSYNIGVDMGFLNDRLRVEADLFKKRNKDMLINVELPSIIGITVPTGNYGELETKGWEISLHWNDVIESAGLKYNVDFNLYDQTDKLTNMASAFKKPTTGIQNIQGYPVNSIFAYETAGYFQTDEEVKNWAFQHAKTGVGDIKYVDQNGDKKITSDDVVYAGTTTPRFCFGLNMGAEWNNFDLSLFFQGVGKRNIYLDTNYSHPYQNAWDNYSFKDLMDYWTPENPDARFPRPHQGAHNYLYSTHWLQNAAYIRLKNIQVGYSLPKNILGKLKLEGLRFYLSGENLWEYTSMLMFDPEASKPKDAATGVYPLNRAVSFGLSLTY